MAPATSRKNWSGQLNPALPRPYTPVRHDIVVEVEVDTGRTSTAGGDTGYDTSVPAST
ncbi:hypothetical protein [Polymorphospora rubra]|uniref:Uncharacterized protein n=1 Tax=Polymorphospora rubra TaxID=338584 RepID=A0A810NCG2_9ACTN|nr:hypothetical protein [Polymorphospora rubra]BCJ69548.1 hypothetical protein Prubr_65690 [Polymorphospora rubra]